MTSPVLMTAMLAGTIAATMAAGDGAGGGQIEMTPTMVNIVRDGGPVVVAIVVLVAGVVVMYKFVLSPTLKGLIEYGQTQAASNASLQVTSENLRAMGVDVRGAAVDVRTATERAHEATRELRAELAEQRR